MKKIFTLIIFGTVLMANAQAYSGKGDIKGQVGANLQKFGTGIHLSTDFGIGENMSVGLATTFLLNTTEGQVSDFKFNERIDLKARFNANLGNVFKLDKAMDIYPGLDLGTKNFGAHLGVRYFFTDGFGLYGEAGLPIAKYDQTASDYNNQFVFNIGASFNL